MSGGSPSITVTTPAGCPVTAISYQPWVTVNSVTASGGTTTVALQVSANAGAARATAIVVADLPGSAVLLDVRENDEWAAGHAPTAVHVPMPLVLDS